MVSAVDVPHGQLIEDTPNVQIPEGFVTDHRGFPVKSEDGKEPFEDFGFLAKTEEKRQEGNHHFREGKYEEAIYSYGEAMMCATTMTTDPSIKLGKSKWAEVLILRSTIALNKSTAHLKIGEYRVAAEMAVECVFGPPRERQVTAEAKAQREQEYLIEQEGMALGFIPPKDPPKKLKPLWKKLPRALRAKAWFRVAQCNAALDYPDRVREALAMALNDCTDDTIPEIQQFVIRFNQDQKDHKLKEKKMYMGFFNKLDESGGYMNDFHTQQKEKRKRFDALSIEEKFRKVNEMSDSEDEEDGNMDDDGMSYLEQQELAIREMYASQQESLLGPKYKERKRREEENKPAPMKKEEAFRPLESYLEVKRALEIVPRQAAPRPQPRVVPKKQMAPTSKNFKPAPMSEQELQANQAQNQQEEKAKKPETAIKKGFFGWKKEGDKSSEALQKDKENASNYPPKKFVPPQRGQAGPQQRGGKPPEVPMKKNDDGTLSPAIPMSMEEQQERIGAMYEPDFDQFGNEIGGKVIEDPEDLIMVGESKYIRRKDLPPELPQDPNQPPENIGEMFGMKSYWEWNTSLEKWELKFDDSKLNPKKKKAMEDVERLQAIKRKQKAAERAKWGDFSSSDEDCPPGYEKDKTYKPPPMD